MAGLLSGVLPYLYQQGDRAKRHVNSLLSDPLGVLEQTAGGLLDSHRAQQNLLAQAFADKGQPFKVTDANAMQAAATNMLAGPLGFAPAGMTRVVGPQDEALEIARRNAVKMLGLPENNTAADRAKALGFTDEVLHGGTNDFPAFKVSDRSNVYTTTDPAVADIYANAVGRHKALREVNANPNVMPLTYRGKLLEVSDQGPGGGGWYGDNLATALGAQPHRLLVKEVPKRGYAGVKISDMDDLGGRQSQYVFPDPSVLRSRFAAFDPARVKENDLLGRADPALLALLGLGSLGGAYLASDK